MRKPIWNFAVVCFAVPLWSIGCSDTEFKGSDAKKPAVKKEIVPVQKTLSLDCVNGETRSELVTDLSGSSKTSLILKGEFCNFQKEEVSGELNVLFVLDFSGSMKENDPLVGDSCGRLRAAQAITDKLQATVPESAEINVGILPFGSTALFAQPLQALETFASEFTSSAFCGVDSGGTNYDDAFVKAKQMLEPLSGNSVVYFISDGVPTMSGTGFLGFGGPSTDLITAKNKGISSAEALRNAIGDNLDLNAIFLGNTGEDNGVAIGFDPKEYLEQVTGDADKVRLVTSAEDLAEEIVSFETPEVLSIDKSSVVGIHSATAYGKQDIELAFFEQDGTRPGIWTFETKPFELFGESGRITENEVAISVEASDGQTQTANIVIKFAIDEDGNVR